MLAIALASATGAATAQALTPAFTYQGELRLSSGPATGNFDMQFRLFNAQAAGAQLGATVTATNVAATGGLFALPLDFGPAQFAGDRQWLEIAIRPAGGGAYETLSPRSEVTAAPYAWSAAVALANSVTSTSIVDGTVGSADINPAQVQVRVASSCPSGQSIRVVNANGTVTCESSSSGPVGPQGPVGPAGPTGPAGPVGPTGLTGPVGPQGPIGNTGVAGSAGAAGAAGPAGPQGPIGNTGVAGPAGAAGPAGPQGPIGNTGAAGPAGATGPAGPQGPIGNTGATGPAGPAGATGATGPQGPAGSSDAWGRLGNAGTNPATNFIGTTDGQSLVFRVNNTQGLRIESGGPVPNLIGGMSGNSVTAGVVAATIGGGGLSGSPNRVTDNYGVVGGGVSNRAGNDLGATTDAAQATVSGGFSNTASGAFSTVGGGEANTASDFRSTVGGGVVNTASGSSSTVSGGQDNTASSTYSTVSGGWSNTASGIGSAVSGGISNCAGGSTSWAGGTRAKVRPAANPGGTGGCSALTYPGGSGDQGTFVWADSGSENFVSTGVNQFLVRAAGGMGINTNTPAVGAALTVAGNSVVTGTSTLSGLSVSGPSTFSGNVSISNPSSLSFGSNTRQMLNLFGSGFGFGVQTNTLYARSSDAFAWFQTGSHNDGQFNAGGGSLLMTLTPGASTSTPTGTARAQSFVNVSDRAAKTAFAAIDAGEVLSRVLALPMASWSYRNRPDVRHLGPVAQDFFSAFGLGEGDRTINTVDADGVALAAIQGLNAKLEAENAALRARLDRLEAVLGERLAGER
jgi:hypothetical protein